MGDYLKMMEEQAMILYSINCKAPITNNEWSIITIHKSLEGAEKAMAYYKRNWGTELDEVKFAIVPINTDIDSDVVYDYDLVNENS